MTERAITSENLIDFEKRVYSQNGEDGILARLFELLDCQCKYFVEFGTGPDGSERNSRLLEEVGWQGLLMDRSPNGANPAIHAAHITAENINELFEKYGVPEEFGLLSIDVDGNDYWIWQAISDRYRPWVVVIEYNAAVPATESKAIAYDPDFSWEITDYFGASLLALDRLGKRKGYRLVYCESTGVNAFFVRADLCPDLPLPAAKLHRPMAQWPHGGAFPRDPRRQMIDVERPAITGVILARDESRNIVSCLETLRPHVSQLILIDMESSDATVSLAEPYIDKLLTHPVVPNFDAVRNIAIPEADFDWLWFVDADEFVPDHVGRQIAALVEGQGDEFEAINYAFATHFGGQWMQHCGWWGGYCTARVLKRGHFRFSETLHRGVELDGREIRLPLDFAVPHFSFRDVEHWVEKFNRYTTVEALQLAQKGATWDWRWAARSLAHDLWQYYELNDAKRDGNRGWILTWACSQYRWFTIAKLVDHFRDSPLSVPDSLDEALQAIVDELHVLRAPRPSLPLGVVFKSPIWDYSGYADEGRAFAKALSMGPAELQLETIDWNDSRCELSARERGLLKALTRAKRSAYVAKITNCIPTLVEPDPAASLNILRTTFETDRIPPEWLAQLAKFDEIWVTSHHTKEAFCRSWVPPEKVRVVHSCIDTEQFSPDGPQYGRLPKPCKDQFVFLSVFDWQLRKGWDALLRAYVLEFSSNARTTLLLKITTHHHQSTSLVTDQANAVLAEFGESLETRHDIVIWEQSLSADDMAALYRTVDAFVLPTRGEGWGRPFMEAMASGLPVIGTNGSGNADFMNEENAFIVQAVSASVTAEAAREMSIYAGHRWLEPDIDDLRRQLRDVYVNPSRRHERSEKAVAQIQAMFGLDAGRSRLEAALEEATQKFKPPAPPNPLPAQISLQLEGEFFAAHSFSNINEKLVVEFSRRSDVALSVKRQYCTPTYDGESFGEHQFRSYFNRELPSGPKIVVRHRFPPNWNPPDANDVWVHIQPWEMHYLPQEWVSPLSNAVDEIWVPSHFVRDAYARSGVDAEKVHVIPWGVDTEVFHPTMTPLLLPTNKSFAFLFVGGTIDRKGFDLLLQAYLEEFQAGEDVCLVVKDQGADTFYRGAAMKARIQAAQLDSNNPELLYFDENMTRGQLASLYAACHCLVAPYRGEGFGLPILEAMACARPAIVPCGGASDDFVSEATGLPIPSKTVEVAGAEPLCGLPTWLEVSVEDLRRAMRSAFERRADLSERGHRAAEFVHANFTWSRTVDTMVERLHILSNRRTSPPPEHANGTGDAATADSRFRIAACVAFHNEERTLAGKLASLMPFVDEIVAVDLHSGDRSAAIAREYGARVIAADTRLAGWELAMQSTFAEWAMLLGPDESVEHDSMRTLHAMIAELTPQDEACSVELSEASDAAQPPAGNRREVRLLRNQSDVVERFRGMQHSRGDANRPSLQTQHLDFRFNYLPSENTEVRLVEWWLAPWIPKTGRVFVDIGANLGTWTQALAPHFRHVHSIEPEPGAVRLLQSQAAENVTVHPFGAWSADADVSFTRFESSVHLSAYFQDEGINTGPSSGTLVLPCRSVDGLDLTDVDFIKCDTEGAEIECLLGAEQTIRRDRPWLLIESHSSGNFSQLTRLLAEWGYMFTVIRDPHYKPFSKLWYEHCWLSCQPYSESDA